MSRETQDWLNNMIRIGDTNQRGNAWWYRGTDRSDGGKNHFPDAVPVEEVRELFKPYEPYADPMFRRIPVTSLDEADGTFDNGQPYKWVEVTNFKAIAAMGKPEVVYNTPSGDYEIHSYNQWLVDHILTLLGGDVHISSAGLLAAGAVGWVELSISEEQTHADFGYRPHLLASTSVNGRYKTEYGRKVQATVCDNTLHIASLEQGQKLSFKHTKNSVPRIKDTADALGLILETGTKFRDDMDKLLNWRVDSRQFSKFLDLAVPLVKEASPETKGVPVPLEGAALTRAENKRFKFASMWNGDPRVAPWKGTAFGVVQLTNTWQHHESGIHSKTVRPERNMLDAISGKTQRSDMDTLKLLAEVSDAPLPVLA